MTPNIRTIEIVLCTLFWILVPALGYAGEEQSLAQALSYLKEKAIGFWISWDGGLFVSETDYIDFRTDAKNQFLIIDQDEKTVLKATGQVIATRWRRLTIRLAALDPELFDVTSKQSFSGSSASVFFVSLISRDDSQAASTFEGTEKRGNKPEKTISGAWPECYLVFQDRDCAERLRQALVSATKLNAGKND